MENLKWFVYMHTNLTNGKVYIGISHDINKRWRGNGCAYKSNHHFWQAIQKYGWDGFRHEIVYDNISHSEACAYEIELIAKYNACDSAYGYNNSPGGESPLVIHRGADHHFYGKHLSADHRKKLSESHKGEKHFWYGKHLPEETRKKIGDAHRGRIISDEQKEFLREINTGKQASEETKRKMSESQKNRVRDPKVGRRISDAKEKKAVVQLSLSNEVIQIFTSVSSAAREYGIASGSICKCCQKELRSAGGFIWIYEDEVDISHLTFPSSERKAALIEEGIRIGQAKQRKKVMQLTVEGELVRIWDSLTQAAKENGMDVSSICQCCKGKIKTSGGYMWRYVDDST